MGDESSIGFIKKVGIARAVSKEKGVYYLVTFMVKGFYNEIIVSLNHLYSRSYAKLFDKPLIHVIGDSHSWAFKRNSMFIIHNIGPATAYNLVNEHSTINSHKKLFDVIEGINKKRDIVVTVFGEIDCRVHIYNQYKKSDGKASINELIDRTVSNYGQVLKQLTEKNVNFCVYGVLPASEHVLRYPPYATVEMREEQFKEFNDRYPYLASLEIRRGINYEFNKRLKNFCEVNGYKYINIYMQVADENGVIQKEYAADEIHVNGKIMPYIKLWFEQNYHITL